MHKFIAFLEKNFDFFMQSLCKTKEKLKGYTLKFKVINNLSIKY